MQVMQGENLPEDMQPPENAGFPGNRGMEDGMAMFQPDGDAAPGRGMADTENCMGKRQLMVIGWRICGLCCDFPGE